MYIRPVLLPSIPVHYEADENGYRVTSMETEEIGSGPVQNKEGKAFVQSLQHGLESTYAIMGKQGRKEWAEMFPGKVGIEEYPTTIAILGGMFY